MMRSSRERLVASLVASAFVLPGMASADSIPSVVVSIENVQPSRGVFLTPPWIGIHDGTFDSYDGGQVASVPLGGNEIEALAEDGNNGPITETFDAVSGGPQVGAVTGPGGPLAPGDRAAVTLNVDPSSDRFFSYASMIIPSNDFFVANGNPVAHPLFNEYGRFVGEDFIVSGDSTNDAGTEVNDEIAGNVAFLNQTAPNTGVTESLPVTTPAPGFAAPGTLNYPDGVLNHPVFANGDFNDADDRIVKFSFRFVDLGARVRFWSSLSPTQEIQADVVDSSARGFAKIESRDAERLRVRIFFRGLSGPLQMAHLHLGQAGVNGPIVAVLDEGIRGRSVSFTVRADDVVGPLADADDPFLALLNELAAGNIYINLHTTEFPAGELRGQVSLIAQR